MNCKLITYKTLSGEKKIARYEEKSSGKWIIYQDKKPKYHLDCFDLKSETGLLLNDLLFSKKKTIKQIVKEVNKKYGTNLSIEKPPLIEIVKDTTIEDIQLETFPAKWLK